jgi:restriction system protein
MAIPDYQTLMLPLLKWLSDGKPHTARETYNHLSQLFNLTADEMSQELPNSNQPIIENRIGWAKTYLKKAGLVNNTQRGIWQISEQGSRFLQANPTKLTNQELLNIPEFLSFKQLSHSSENQTKQAEVDTDENTPTELMDSSYQKIRETLAAELLNCIKACSPAFFERLVVDVMLALGYGGSRHDTGKATRLTKDGGIDGIIQEDKLGLDMIYLQAKRWETTVGRPDIQKFAGALQGERAKKGVFITTSDFSCEAINYVKHLDVKIILINGARLAELMIDYNVGVSTRQVYEMKQIDSDYFEDAD